MFYEFLTVKALRENPSSFVRRSEYSFIFVYTEHQSLGLCVRAEGKEL